MSRVRRTVASLVPLAVLIGSMAASVPTHAAPTPSTLYFEGPSSSPPDCSLSTGICSDSAHTTTVTSFSGTAGNINVRNGCSGYAVV